MLQLLAVQRSDRDVVIAGPMATRARRVRLTKVVSAQGQNLLKRFGRRDKFLDAEISKGASSLLHESQSLKPLRLTSVTASHYPNFNALRLLAASAVVFSHAFLLATGSEETEPLHSTGMTAGVYGVFVFFILSGFLVTESAKRSSGVLDYGRKTIFADRPGPRCKLLSHNVCGCPVFRAQRTSAIHPRSECPE